MTSFFKILSTIAPHGTHVLCVYSKQVNGFRQRDIGCGISPLCCEAEQVLLRHGERYWGEEDSSICGDTLLNILILITYILILIEFSLD